MSALVGGRAIVAAVALMLAGTLGATAQAKLGDAGVRSADVVPTPVDRHPPHNITPKPSYVQACAHNHSNSALCLAKAVAAIDRARRLEHVRRMILPDNFTKLTFAEQTFVVTNLERVDRGLAPFRGLTSKLNSSAHDAAVGDVDPVPATSVIGRATVMNYASNWTSNFGSLAGDYGWMYDDGYGSYNVDCPKPAAPGCWGHRDNILSKYNKQPLLISGAGSDPQSGLISIAQLFVAAKGSAPKFTYRWAQALAHGADGHKKSVAR